ncbi:hypothetical protein LNV09_24495 [Paucibacter sp. B2R-40]|uniref:hypothetical protein n=1 Tax=Paucibacter sp. B2R-40 TaxID=2893554 RepID=UPI0021E35AB7|nr:hypothetical protein [Paucibacter sp. B2R-40]MCV2357317.1 hypothetical protein [Paucibacter sp. B2R-40]
MHSFSRSVVGASSLFVLALNTAFTFAAPLPSGATAVIAKVNREAKSQNYTNLREQMIQDFSWSFGGDASAEQAIETWRKQPGYLRQLSRVTGEKCVLRKDKIIECPRNAGTSFRAGFQELEGIWKFVYFVEGD